MGDKGPEDKVVFLDEDDVTDEALDKMLQQSASGGEKPKQEPEKKEDKPVDEGAPKDEPKEGDGEPQKSGDGKPPWMEEASKAGWVPDHVRAKHADEARTLREERDVLARHNEALLKILQGGGQGAQNQHQEERKPTDFATVGDVESLRTILNDRAALSQHFMRLQVNDYDAVVQQHLAPLVTKNPWMDGYIRAENNPAKTAYDLACAIRDGKQLSAEMVDGQFRLSIVDPQQRDPKPKGDEPTSRVVTPQGQEPQKKANPNPPVAAIKNAQKQPVTLDDIQFSDIGTVEMTMEQFAKLPTSTLLRLKKEKPDYYEKMFQKLNEAYG